jgi:hypothetical protein
MQQMLFSRERPDLLANGLQKKAVGLYGNKRYPQPRGQYCAAAASILHIEEAIPEHFLERGIRSVSHAGFVANRESP